MTSRERHLKRLYGITLDQYNELLEKQNQRCAICDRHKDEFKTNLCVDHDHLSGLIRGLLCTYCNRRLVGRHRDSRILRRIADYIDQHTGWKVPDVKRRARRKKKNTKSITSVNESTGD